MNELFSFYKFMQNKKKYERNRNGQTSNIFDKML